MTPLINAIPAMRDGCLPVNLIDHIMVTETAQPIRPHGFGCWPDRKGFPHDIECECWCHEEKGDCVSYGF